MKVFILPAIALILGGCQSLVNYQEGLYLPDGKPIGRGPDYPWCPGKYNYIFPSIGSMITFVPLAATPQGGACADKNGLTNVYNGAPTFQLSMSMDYGRGYGAAVGYWIGMLDKRDIETMNWYVSAGIVVPVAESKPPLSRDHYGYTFDPDKVVEDDDLVINGLNWRHRYAMHYNPYGNPYHDKIISYKPGSLDGAYEVYVHKLPGGQLLTVRGHYKSYVVKDPSWIAARRKTLRDMVGFVHVDPIPARMKSPKS
ncbi:MAG TPA: hypothetical protein VHC20_06770 [Candidatus Paceibacterota bacterium]|nr:hypothetical protein [Candidatus Paceibacterota bacterium]